MIEVQQQARELVKKFYSEHYILTKNRERVAKQCALICVDEMIKECYKQGNSIAIERQDYLNNLKQTINEL